MDRHSVFSGNEIVDLGIGGPILKLATKTDVTSADTIHEIIPSIASLPHFKQPVSIVGIKDSRSWISAMNSLPRPIRLMIVAMSLDPFGDEMVFVSYTRRCNGIRRRPSDLIRSIGNLMVDNKAYYLSGSRTAYCQHEKLNDMMGRFDSLLMEEGGSVSTSAWMTAEIMAARSLMIPVKSKCSWTIPDRMRAHGKTWGKCHLETSLEFIDQLLIGDPLWTDLTNKYRIDGRWLIDYDGSDHKPQASEDDRPGTPNAVGHGFGPEDKHG